MKDRTTVIKYKPFIIVVLLLISFTFVGTINSRAWSASVDHNPQTVNRGETVTFSITVTNVGSDKMKVEEVFVHFGWLPLDQGYHFTGTPKVMSSGSSATFTRSVPIPVDIYDGISYSTETTVTARDPGFWGEWALSPNVKTFYGTTYVEKTLPPTVEITFPSEGHTFNTNSVNLTWSGNVHSPDTINYYRVNLSGDEWVNVGTNTRYTFTNIEDGTHTVKVEIIDSRWESNLAFVTFTVDTTPPVFNIISPSEGNEYNVDTVTIKWTGSDATSGIDYYEVRINGGPWINLGMNTSYVFRELSDGEHTVDIRAVDKVGNSATDSITFTVSTGLSEFLSNYWWLLLLIVIIMVIVFTSIFKLGKGKVSTEKKHSNDTSNKKRPTLTKKKN